MSSDGKKLRTEIDQAIKEMNNYGRSQLSLTAIVEAHQKMAVVQLNVEDKFQPLRQSCLKGLSQFADDYSLQKVRDLCTKLA